MGFFNNLAAWISGKAPKSAITANVPRGSVDYARSLPATGQDSYVHRPVVTEPFVEDIPQTTPAPTTPLSAVDAEVAELFQTYSFVLDFDPSQLQPDQLWWPNVQSETSRRHDLGLAHSWLLPFMTLEVAKYPEFILAHAIGPAYASRMAVQLRSEIRTRRKRETPIDEYLQGLFGLAVMQECLIHFSASELASPYTYPSIAQFVSSEDLMSLGISFQTIGYKHCRYLLKTDVKWLIAEFGEPTDHLFIETLLEPIWRKAVRRYCWFVIRQDGRLSNTDAISQQAMRNWMRERFKAFIDQREYSKQMEELRAEQADRALKLAEAATALLEGSFVVADVLPTGPNLDSDSLLEISALKIGPGGVVVAEFAELIAVNQPLMRCVAEVKCIATANIVSIGHPLKDVLSRFSVFVGGHTMLLRSAPFAMGFLNKAMHECGVMFNVNVLDISAVPISDWPTGLVPEGVPDYPRHQFPDALCASLSAVGRELAKRDSCRRNGRRLARIAGETSGAHLHWEPTGQFPITAVGTSYHEADLKTLAKNMPGHAARTLCTATLQSESTNVHDSNAICVLIANQPVGYLSRAVALAFRDYFARRKVPLQPTTCDALISNGLFMADRQYSYSVSLDIDLVSSKPKPIAPTYPQIEHHNPDPIFHKMTDGSYLVEARIDPDVFDDMHKHKLIKEWTTDHWDTFNYYLSNSRNIGLGHKLFGIKKTAVNDMFNGEFPSGTMFAMVGPNVLVSLPAGVGGGGQAGEKEVPTGSLSITASL
jgi:hypothetical protein